MKKSEIKTLIKEVLTEAVPVPSNVMEFAKRKGPYAVALVKKAATWAKKSGRDISGGTAIGKNYSTIVLDMKYQGSEIYINLDKETIELFDKEVTDAKSFAKVLADNEETLREDKNNLQVKGTYLGRKGVFYNFKKDLFGRTIATFRTDDKTSGGLKTATMGIYIDKNEDVKFDGKDTKIKENTTFGDKLATHNKKSQQYKDFYAKLKSKLMDKYGYGEEDMEDETAERKNFVKYKISKEADDLFFKKFKIKYQDVENPFQVKENQSYQGTITDDSAEYILKDLGFKLQHQYDSISGLRFFGPLDQLQKARNELKRIYDIESTISGYGKFAYKELSVPNQVID